MPDVREIMLLMPGESGRFRWGKLLSRVKLALRRGVVATSRTPLRHLYLAIYRAHASLAVRAARKLPGTRAVYITRSMATGAITIGVSDIDMVVIGDWPEPEQIRLMRSLGTLTAISPLFDSGLWQQVYTLDNFRDLWHTDYFFQSRFDEGRRQWKLVHGEDIIATLPPVPETRLGGGLYMETRSWWLHLIASVFGRGPTAQDPIFRNSIAYKAVTEIATIDRTLRTGTPTESRDASLRLSMQESPGDFLDRLQQSADRNHLSFRGDLQAESVQFLLPMLDRIHAQLATRASFESIGDFHVDAAPNEILRRPSAVTNAHDLVQRAKQWPSYQAAFLAPSAACFAMDNLLLLIQLKPGQWPTLAQMRDLCQRYQGLSIYLLLPHGACQLDFVNFTEMWRVLIFPPSSPDLFTLIQRPEFQIDGTPVFSAKPLWTRFALDLALEERNVRRSVLNRVTPDVFPSSLEILRNVYRHLQLEVLTSTATFALSPAAIERHITDPVLPILREAYFNELNGNPTDVRPLVPQILTLLKTFS